MPNPPSGTITQLSGIPVFVSTDSTGTSVVPTTEYTNANGVWIPRPTDKTGYPLNKGAGRNTLLTSGTMTFSAGASSGTQQSVLVSLPAVSQPDALYLVSLMNPTGTPQGLTVTVGTSGSVGSNLAASTTYYYAVSAVGPWGETLIGSTASGTEGSTAYPISLSWNAQGGATSYNIYKGTSASGVDLLATGTTGTSYTDSGNTATSSTAPPTSSMQGPGTSVTAAFSVAQVFGTTTTYYAEITSVDVADGVTQSYLVQGWLLGDGASQLQVSLDNGASNPAGSVWYEVTMV